MRPRVELPPVPLSPLSRGDREYIRSAAAVGCTPEQIACWSGRPLAEVRQVLEREKQPS